MKLLNLLLLLGAAYLAVVGAQDQTDDESDVYDETADAPEEASAPLNPCACSKVYKPVCGSDDVTYSNPCMLKCENANRAKDGKPELTTRCKTSCDQCPESCICTKEYKPVCGSDGVTYSNPCMLKCENAKRAKDGKPELITRCETSCDQCPKSCTCTREYKPVCGSDGVTYSNPSMLKCENAKRAKDGKPELTTRCETSCDQCLEPCICTKEYKPVCGSDGVTYSNPCMLKCENAERAKDGKPELITRCETSCDKCPEPCICTREYKPVCGSDGVTYSNPCMLKCENEHRAKEGKKAITVNCQNACAKCPCACPLNYAPVCGSDGVTYGNECSYNCQNKKLVSEGKPEISLRCKNECNKCPVEDVCPLNYSPVCGSDGVTYSNECMFNAENKRRSDAGKQPIEVNCQRVCEECPEAVASTSK